MSASVNSTIAARAAAMPALRALARPVYGPGRWRTLGELRAISAKYSAVPSFEFESATITSKASGRRSCATSDGMT